MPNDHLPNDHFTTDCIVIGAGVIGLAVARALAVTGREVIVLEREGAMGTHASSRNSEVIHAGIYYPAGSLKARLCVEGKHALYAFCAERGIAHRRCGKLIVATSPAQAAALEGIRARAAANGVDDLRLLSAAEARAVEPALACEAALLSPSTGIIDSHALMLACLGEAEDHGAAVAFHAPVERILAGAAGHRVETGGPSPAVIEARAVVNAAGLFAPDVAARMDGLGAAHVPVARYCKGSYFSLAGRAPFSRLIYPVPETAGLGVHLTLDLGGQARFGPDTQWVDGIDYAVDPARGEGFYEAVRRYWPGLADGALVPAYAGVRPKISGPDDPAADFRIDGPEVHGISGLINLFGIESPGLTASLAIADAVAGEVAARLA